MNAKSRILENAQKKLPEDILEMEIAKRHFKLEMNNTNKKTNKK